MEKIKPYLPYIILGIAVFYLLNKGAQKLGLTESKEDKQAAGLLFSKWLNPQTYIDWRKKTGFKIPKQFEDFFIAGITQTIWDSKNFFNDDEEQLYSQFRKIQSKMQFSLISYYFQTQYKRNLGEFLNSFLSSDELLKVKSIINSKPDITDPFYKI
jgi:hypothetical protein